MAKFITLENLTRFKLKCDEVYNFNPVIDEQPTQNSDNLVKSGGVWDFVNEHTPNADNGPIDGSENLVKSGGVYDFVVEKQPVVWDSETTGEEPAPKLDNLWFDPFARKIYHCRYNGSSKDDWYDMTPTHHRVIDDVSITSSMYTSDNTYTEYPYKITLPLNAVNYGSIVEVTFSMADATSGNFAPVCETADACVILYAKEIVETTIPRIIIVNDYIGGDV